MKIQIPVVFFHILYFGVLILWFCQFMYRNCDGKEQQQREEEKKEERDKWGEGMWRNRDRELEIKGEKS